MLLTPLSRDASADRRYESVLGQTFALKDSAETRTLSPLDVMGGLNADLDDDVVSCIIDEPVH